MVEDRNDPSPNGSEEPVTRVRPGAYRRSRPLHPPAEAGAAAGAGAGAAAVAAAPDETAATEVAAAVAAMGAVAGAGVTGAAAKTWAPPASAPTPPSPAARPAPDAPLVSAAPARDRPKLGAIIIGLAAVLLLAIIALGIALASRDDSDDVAAGAGDTVTTDAQATPTSSADRVAVTSAGAASSPTSATGTGRATEADATTAASTAAPTTVAPTTAAPTTAAAPVTAAAPATVAAPNPVPGGPTPVLAVFSADRVLLEGVVPSVAAQERLEALALANAKPPATIVSRLSIDPAVPVTVPVRVIELQSVRFPTGSAVVTPEHAVELDRVANVMLALPEVTVLAVGHADQIGPEESNLVLSNARAVAVVNHLASRGVGMERLSAVGVGETDLLTEDLGEDSRALNRRTEFIFSGLFAG